MHYLQCTILHIWFKMHLFTFFLLFFVLNGIRVRYDGLPNQYSSNLTLSTKFPYISWYYVSVFKSHRTHIFMFYSNILPVHCVMHGKCSTNISQLNKEINMMSTLAMIDSFKHFLGQGTLSCEKWRTKEKAYPKLPGICNY